MKSKGAAGLDSVMLLFLVGIASLVTFNFLNGTIEWKVKDIGCVIGDKVDPATKMPLGATPTYGEPQQRMGFVENAQYPCDSSADAESDFYIPCSPIPAGCVKAGEEKDPDGLESFAVGTNQFGEPFYTKYPAMKCPIAYSYTVNGEVTGGVLSTEDPNLMILADGSKVAKSTMEDGSKVSTITKDGRTPFSLPAGTVRGADAAGNCAYFAPGSPRPKPQIPNRFSVPYFGCNSKSGGTNG